jgi:hypothetical protein
MRQRCLTIVLLLECLVLQAGAHELSVREKLLQTPLPYGTWITSCGQPVRGMHELIFAPYTGRKDDPPPELLQLLYGQAETERVFTIQEIQIVSPTRISLHLLEEYDEKQRLYILFEIQNDTLRMLEMFDENGDLYIQSGKYVQKD